MARKVSNEANASRSIRGGSCSLRKTTNGQAKLSHAPFHFAPQPNFSVKPTPTSSACRFPACFALRCGLPRALGFWLPSIGNVANSGHWCFHRLVVASAAFLLSPSVARISRRRSTGFAGNDLVAWPVSIWLSVLRQPAHRCAALKCHTPSPCGCPSFGGQCTVMPWQATALGIPQSWPLAITAWFLPSLRRTWQAAGHKF